MSAVTATVAAAPFVGPVALGVDDEIFGRDREISDVRDLLVAERILLLYSPSGAGKTSLLEAGLRRRLTADGFTVLPRIRVAHELPAGVDARAVGNRYRLSSVLELDEARGRELTLDVRELSRVGLEEYLQRHRDGRGEQCLFFDQFEELFTTDPTDEQAKAEFLGELGAVLADPGRWAILSMREDFIAQLDPYLKLLPARLRSRYRLDLLRPGAARLAILRPGANQDVRFTEEAADRLVDNLRMVQVQRDGQRLNVPGPYVEPVQLQVVCLRLWHQLSPTATAITAQHVNDFGDIDNALAGFYDAAVESVAESTGVGERTIRWWVGRELVTEHGFRNQVLEGPGVAGDQVLRALEGWHLLRAERRRDALWYELAHDRLVEPINESNRTWSERNLSVLQRTSRLWHDAHRPEHLLLSGDHLSDAKAWARAHPDELESVDEDLLVASERGARRRRNVRRLVKAALLVGVLALIASAVAGLKWREANDRRDKARQTERALEGFVLAQGARLDPAQRLAFDRQALANYGEGETVPSFIVRAAMTHLQQAQRAAWAGSVTGYRPAVVAVSADGSTLAWPDATGVQVASVHQPRRGIFIPGDIFGIALSSDGAFVAVGADDEDGPRITVLRTENGARLFPPLEPGAPPRGADPMLAFAADDNLLVTTFRSPGVFDLNTSKPRPLASLEEFDSAGLDATLPGAVAAWNAGGEVRFIDLDTGRAVFDDDLGDVVRVTMSRDGSRVAVMHSAGLTVFDIEGSSTVLEPDPGAVAVTVGGDASAVTLSSGCTLTVWNGGQSVATRELQHCPSDAADAVGFQATFSANGSVVVKAHYDGLVQAWDVGTGERVFSSALMAAASASSLATVGLGPGGQIVLDSVEGPQRQALDAGEPVHLVALSEDSSALIAATRDHLLRWGDSNEDDDTDAVTDLTPEPSRSLGAVPELLAVSGDGTVATAAAGDRVWRWSEDRLRSITLPHGPVSALAVTYYGSDIYAGTDAGVVVVSDSGSAGLEASDPRGPAGVRAIATDSHADTIAVAGVGGADGDAYVEVFLQTEGWGDLVGRASLTAEPTALAFHDDVVVVATTRGVEIFRLGGQAELVPIGGYELADPTASDTHYGYDRPVVVLSPSPGDLGFVALAEDGFVFEVPADPGDLYSRVDEVATAADYPSLSPELCRLAGVPAC